MPTRDTLGGVVHTYQKYDPARIPPPRPPRPAGGRGQQRSRPPREQGPRTYVASGPSGPPKPLTKAMKTGKEPLRTFGDLKQFFESKGATEPPRDPPPPEGSA